MIIWIITTTLIIIILIFELIKSYEDKIKVLKFRISNTLEYIENEKHISKEHLKDILTGEYD